VKVPIASTACSRKSPRVAVASELSTEKNCISSANEEEGTAQ